MGRRGWKRAGAGIVGVLLTTLLWRAAWASPTDEEQLWRSIADGLSQNVVRKRQELERMRRDLPDVKNALGTDLAHVSSRLDQLLLLRGVAGDSPWASRTLLMQLTELGNAVAAAGGPLEDMRDAIARTKQEYATLRRIREQNASREYADLINEELSGPGKAFKELKHDADEVKDEIDGALAQAQALSADIAAARKAETNRFIQIFGRTYFASAGSLLHPANLFGLADDLTEWADSSPLFRGPILRFTPWGMFFLLGAAYSALAYGAVRLLARRRPETWPAQLLGLAFIAAVCFWPGPGLAQFQPLDPSPVDKTLKVGVAVAPPFVEKDPSGHYIGVAIDLWEDLAEDLGIRFEVEEYGLEELLTAVVQGTVDVGVSALSLTPEREAVMDFSQPFYYSGLGIAVPAANESKLERLVDVIFASRLLLYVGSLLTLLLVVGLGIWLLERRRNPDHFRPGGKGIGDGMWWSAVTMTSVGYGDATPKTFLGRLLAMVWMFASVALLATFTAGITSSLTIGTLAGRVHGPDDLHKVRTGVIAGSAAEEELVGSHIGVRSFAAVEDGFKALVRGELDAFVYDQPILHYYQHRGFTGDIRILPGFFDPQLYGFAFTRGSALRKSVNVALLRRLADTEYRAKLYGPYLGKQAIR